MSIYNLMYGINPLTIFIIPMLFDEHPDLLPRFRDVKMYREEDKHVLCVLSRIGKKYHNQGMGEEKYKNHPCYIGYEDKLVTKDFTDDTYAYYKFSVPEEYKSDFNLLLRLEYDKMSEAYKKKVYDMFPKLQEFLNQIFEK